MNPFQRKLLGIGLVVVGSAMALIAALVAWNAVQRWIAVSETRTAATQMLQGRFAEARIIASRAASRVPDEAAPALLAVNLADPAAVDRLESLAPRARGPDRSALLATVALARTLRGGTAPDLSGTGDGRLIEVLRASRAGRTPPALFQAGEEPPHRQLQRAVFIQLLQQAWNAYDAEQVRILAGSLQLLQPRSLSEPLVPVLLNATSPEVSETRFLSVASESGIPREALASIAHLVPARRAAIHTRWPELAPAKAKP